MLPCSRSRSLRSRLFKTPLLLSAQVAVLTQNSDNARTGANLAETALTPASVGSG